MFLELGLLYFGKNFINGLVVGELRNTWALFLGNAERHITFLIYHTLKKSDSEYFCRLLYIKISSCLPVGIMGKHFSICKEMMLMHEQTFVHSSDIFAPHICWNNWVCTYSVAYWDTETHIHIKKLLANGKRRKKLIYLKWCT